jgi:hypothetical protein
MLTAATITTFASNAGTGTTHLPQVLDSLEDFVGRRRTQRAVTDS